MPHVLMFPGQSSADPLMIRRALAMHACAHDVLARAEAVLGREAMDRYTSPSGARLESNRDVQRATFITTQMHLAAMRAEGLEDGPSLGLSIGEYSHLVHIGAVTFEAGLAMVDARGAAYDAAPAGTMVTILGPGRDEVEESVAAARTRGVVVVSNYNAPTQHVIAGHGPAVEYVAERLEQEHGAHTIQTESRVPMHSPLLADAAVQFRPHLEGAPWQAPRRAYLPNVAGRVNAAAKPQAFVDCLLAHVTGPVRWQESVEWLAEEHPGAAFVEVGPGEVLHNMLARRWLPVARAHTDDRSGRDPAGHFQSLVKGLRVDA